MENLAEKIGLLELDSKCKAYHVSSSIEHPKINKERLAQGGSSPILKEENKFPLSGVLRKKQMRGGLRPSSTCDNPPRTTGNPPHNFG